MEEETRSLMPEELETLLENCTRLARDNQLTEGRLWQLSLPQYMPELAKQDSAAFSFHKVSLGLDAAVQIYSKRVDSIHNAALDTRTRLVHQQRQQEASDEIAAEEEAAMARRSRRRSEFEGDTTLVENWDQITSKEISDDSAPPDPLFHKLSTIFDAQGLQGLPTVRLGLRKGCKYWLDSEEIPSKSVYRGYEIPEGYKLRLEEFGMKFERHEGSRKLTPSLSKLEAMLNLPERAQPARILVQRAKDAVRQRHEAYPVDKAPPDPSDQPHCPEQMEVEADADPVEGQIVPGDPDPVEDPPNDPPLFDGTQCLRRSIASHPHSLDANDNGIFETCSGLEVTDALRDGLTAAQTDILDEDTLQWLLDPNHDISKSCAWTGASHWKYPHISETNQNKSATPRRQREQDSSNRTELSFTDLPEVDLSKFAKPQKEASIFAQFKTDDTNLLPPDFHFTASDLLSLPLLPSSRPRDWISRSIEGTARLSEMPEDIGGFEFGDVYGERDGDDFGLIEVPALIEEDRFDIEVAIPVRVNMHQLKSALWTKIEDLHVAGYTEISLGVLYAGQDISFGIFFVCILHLANEHEFHVETTLEGDGKVVMKGHSV